MPGSGVSCQFCIVMANTRELALTIYTVARIKAMGGNHCQA